MARTSKPSARKTGEATAEKYLSVADPILAAVIKRVGPCQINRRRGGFEVICRMIIFQQLSGKAADTIFQRFRALCPRNKPTAAVVALLSDQQLREVGLSRQKISYLRDLVRHVENGTLNFSRLSSMSDHAVTEHLVQVKGIGQWTAEMYLMFVLGRPDVFSAGDLGLRTGIKKLYSIRRKKFNYAKFAERWKPHRTVASWYLWRSLEK